MSESPVKSGEDDGGMRLDYKNLLDEASDIIYVHDLDGNFLYANNAAMRFSGYKKEAVCRVNIADVLSPENLSFVREVTKRQADGKPTRQPYELEIIKRDGTTGWLEFHTKPLQKDGEPIGIQGIGRDITEKKKLEAALQRSKDKYRNLIESANDGIVTVDLHGNFTLINKMGERISGYRREELIGQPLSKLVCREYLPVISERLKERTGGVGWEYTYEIKIFNKAGERVPLEITTNLITEDGRPIGSQVIARDITKRKELENALRESEEYYRGLMENAADAIFVLSDKGRYLDANSKTFELTGYSREELFDMKVQDLFLREQQNYIDQKFREVLKEGRCTGEDLYMLRKEGAAVPVDISASSIDLGGSRAVMCIARDVTERKKMEVKLGEKIRELERFNRLAVGRELKMIELKKRIKELEKSK